ncbi:hypothetical protein E2562_035866 [Oryza meyeriana var. granulata]|uniref:Uncharacterized protein n=1 Tax=Oryza meyeriana var. granulata TaxID=110450 RepID=A0A6G1CWU0_9ORYZ|nr:hypothetical protein E2562_035866 [Oryza meyeriana var. granulata]
MDGNGRKRPEYIAEERNALEDRLGPPVNASRGRLRHGNASRGVGTREARRFGARRAARVVCLFPRARGRERAMLLRLLPATLVGPGRAPPTARARRRDSGGKG